MTGTIVLTSETLSIAHYYFPSASINDAAILDSSSIDITPNVTQIEAAEALPALALDKKKHARLSVSDVIAAGKALEKEEKNVTTSAIKAKIGGGHSFIDKVWKEHVGKRNV